MSNVCYRRALEKLKRAGLLVAAVAALALLPLATSYAVLASPGWVSPTGFADPSGDWTDEALAYDEDTLTYAYGAVPKGGWCGYVEYSVSALDCDKVRAWLDEGVANVSNWEVDVYYSSAWNNIFTGSEPAYGQYVEFPIGSTQSVTGVRLRAYSTKADADGAQVYEVDFSEAVGGEAPTVTTQPPTDIGDTTATLNGTITATGGEDASYRGFVWDTTSHADPGNIAPASSDYTYYWTESGTFGVGAFSHGATGLTPDELYFVRAVAYNSAGWEYGDTEQSFLTGTAEPESPPSWLGDWAYRVKLTIDNTDVDDALSNFPTLVYLSTSSGRGPDDVSFIFDELENDANRKKIAVTQADGTTQYYVEIEKWDDANEQAWLWVKVPSVASGADTDLYLYYDKTGADNDTYVGDPNSTPAENVWDSDFKLVTHMQDDPDASHVRDSTGNSNDGTKTAANTPLEVVGPIGRAQEFDAAAANHGMDCGRDSSLNPTRLTIEALIDVDTAPTAGQWRTICSKDYRAYEFTFGYGGTPGDYHMYLLMGDGTNYDLYNSEFDLSLNTEYRVAVTLDETNVKFYADGDLKKTIGQIKAIGVVDTDLTIGQRSPGGEWYGGVMDEVRISLVDRTAAWIKASNESERDDLLDFGSEEFLLCYAPTGFVLTLSDSTVAVSWTIGIGATTTVVRRQAERYPADVTDGVEAYNGVGVSFDDTGLNVEDNEYFYRAWSHNASGYSADYAEGIIGGVNMILIGIVILVLGLTVAAFFIRSGMLYAACIPAWLIFTFFMFNATWPGENPYLPTAIAIFGVIMTIVMVAVTGMHYIGNRSSEPTYDEEKAANLRRIYKLTHTKKPWED